MSTHDSVVDRTPARSVYRDGRVLSAAAIKHDAHALATGWNGHQAVTHGAGVVAGLWLTVTSSGFQVGPGAAVDARGRLLVLGSSTDVPPLDSSATEVAVWLRYSEERAAVRERGSDLERWKECPQPYPRVFDAAAGCHRPSSQDGVFLGICRRHGANDDWEVDLSGRVYIGAVGGRIDAPSGRTRVLLGPEFPRDSRRFAVGVRAGAGAAHEFADVISWETTGSLTLRSPTAVVHPQEKKSRTDATLQPPTAIVGVPRVYLSVDDVVDPGRAWEMLSTGLGAGAQNQQDPRVAFARLLLVAKVKAPAYPSMPGGQPLIAWIINRLLWSVAEACFDAAAHGDASAANRLVLRQLQVLSDVLRHRLLVRLFPARANETHAVRVKREQAANMTLEKWQASPDAVLCRLLIDELFAGSIHPLTARPSRGIVFKEAGPAEPEPSPGKVRLVQYQKDGRTVRELRITIPDPGEKNNPQRYRCSIGQTTPPGQEGSCTNEGLSDDGPPLNLQTGQPRGILSVLADRSVEIHSQLNVFADPQTLLPGLILKLAPPNQAAAGAAGGPPGTTTPVLANAVHWDSLEPKRVSENNQELLLLTGTLRNATALEIRSLFVHATLQAKDDTQLSPYQETIASQQVLGSQMTAQLDKLAGHPVRVPVPEGLKDKTLRLYLLVLGVVQGNTIVQTREQKVVPKP